MEELKKVEEQVVLEAEGVVKLDGDAIPSPEGESKSEGIQPDGSGPKAEDPEHIVTDPAPEEEVKVAPSVDNPAE